MKNSRFQAVIIFFTTVIFLTGCKVTHNFKEDEFLLTKNSIVIDKSKIKVEKLSFDPTEMPGLIQQKTNKKLLGIVRLGVWVNSFTTKGKPSKFKNWLNRNMGQEPVILDKFLINRSTEQLQLYLDNHGYFNTPVVPEIKTRKKKAQVNYKIILTEPYRIKNIQLNIEDTTIRSLVFNSFGNSLIKKNQVYDATKLDDERYRIADILRDEGYFYFAPEFVYFQIDSAFSNKQLDVFLNVEQVQIPQNNDSLFYLETNHKKYFVNNFLINTDFKPVMPDNTTTKIYINPSSENGINRYHFYYDDKLKIRPGAIRNSILMEPLQIYRQTSEKNTYKQLSGLPLFGYTNISFKEVADKTNTPDTLKNYLDCNIDLVRRPVQSFSVETEGTTSGGKLGMNGNFVYQNLNIFRGGEVLTLKLTGGVEWQEGGQENRDVFWFFNTFETGAEASLDFPKFLLPVSQDKIPKFLRPRTTIKTGTNYQNRPDYKRYITNVSFGYNWRSREFVSHSLTPIEINSVSIFPDSAFMQKINDLNDPRLTNQYTDHFIMAIKYTYIFNNQERNKVKNFTFFRWNFESAGNLLALGNSVFDGQKNENDQYTVWNIPFSQYLRSDIDFRYYFAFNEENTLVYRNLFGLGKPIGNSTVLPFEKGFYSGGANDMRGWSYRSLGPGSFQDTSSTYFEKMGDIILEANLEYRFPVYSFLKGALFADFGNIWLLNNSENYPGGKLQAGEILSEIAIDAGIGVRFDFSFFIFRIDGAAPIRDPALDKGNRWQINSLQMRDVIWNFGIGYPF